LHSAIFQIRAEPPSTQKIKEVERSKLSQVLEKKVLECCIKKFSNEILPNNLIKMSTILLDQCNHPSSIAKGQTEWRPKVCCQFKTRTKTMGEAKWFHKSMNMKTITSTSQTNRKEAQN
jgi:hypothetical protein